MWWFLKKKKSHVFFNINFFGDLKYQCNFLNVVLCVVNRAPGSDESISQMELNMR